MKNLTEYFNQKNCPAVNNLSVAEVKKICAHVQALLKFEDKEILSLGCGDGRIEEILFSEVKLKKITLADISERNLKMAQEKLPYAKFIQSDLRKFPAQDFESYDFIYSLSLAQYLSANELRTLHKNFFDNLKPEGKIFHFNVPDNRRKFLYRVNNAIIMEDLKYLLPRYDFIDEFSRWCKKKDFYAEGYNTKFLTPSYCWERFDVVLTKKAR